MNYCKMIIINKILYFPPKYMNGRGVSLNCLTINKYYISEHPSTRPIKFLERMKVTIESL